MFRLTHPLYFPLLKRVGETTFKAHSDVSRSTGLYVLNWAELDRIRKERYEKRTKIEVGQQLPPFPGTLPKKYSWVEDIRFALPRHYLDQIRQSTRQAMDIWGREYGFDTMIREICLEPAISHSYVAFRLLADCVYDEKTNYWSRDDSKFIVPQALLYKFWSFQTGRGLVRDHAKFNKITWILESGPQMSNDSKSNEVMKFLDAIKEYEEDLEKCFPSGAIEESPVGPSIGDSSATLKWAPQNTVSSNQFISISGDSSYSVNTDEKVFSITGSDGTERPNVKTPVKATNEGITVCTTCKDRNEDLLRCLPSWMKYGFQNLIIVDWGSEQPVLETVTEYELLYGKVDDVDIKIIRVDTDEPFVSSVAKNLALRACETDKVLLIDADVKLKGFDYDLDKCSYAGMDTPKGTSGTCFVKMEDIDRIGGFNEEMVYWGGEEVDFRNRLKKHAKIEMLSFRPGDLDHLDHSDHIRLKNRGQKGVTKIEGQRYNISKTKPWSPSNLQKKISVTIYRNGKMKERNVEM